MAIMILPADGMDAETTEAIAVCKSASGVCGMKLRDAHKNLGESIGALIAFNMKEAQSIAVVIMMRAGLPFAIGIADSLESNGKSVVVAFSTKEKPFPDELSIKQFDLIILADAVIRTGKGMLALAANIIGEKIIFATNVLDETGIQNFKEHTVYAVRLSKNSFIGTLQKTVTGNKGPDTGDRLFNSNFSND